VRDAPAKFFFHGGVRNEVKSHVTLTTATVYSFFFAVARETRKIRLAARYIPKRPKFLRHRKKTADAYTFARRRRLRVRHEPNIRHGRASSAAPSTRGDANDEKCPARGELRHFR
jgi:hypothetical protein